MKRKYESQSNEVLIDPSSPFWSLHEPIDPNGDPLDLMIRAEEGDEVAIQLLTNEKDLPAMNYLQNLRNLQDGNKLSREGLILAIRSTSNWANGNIMTISQIRLRNFAKTGDPDGSVIDDSVVNENEHEQNDHSAQNGGQQQLTLTQRGDAFAAVRRACVELANELNLTGYDAPRSIGEYIDSRVTGLRKSVPSKEDVAAEMKNSMGVSEEEARDFLNGSFKTQAAEMEKSKADVVAEDTTYDDSVEFEEALSVLGVVDQHRLQIKVISDIVRETKRIQKLREKYPTFEDLRTKRHLLLWDVVTLDEQFHAFEKANKAQIDKELLGTNRMLGNFTREIQMTLDLVKRQAASQVAA